MQPRASIFARFPLLGLVGLLLMITMFFHILMPDKFLNLETFHAIAFQMPELGLLTLAMFLPFISAGFNLSIIVTANLCSLLMAWLWVTYVPAGASIHLQLFWLVVALLAAGLVAVIIGTGIGSMVAFVGIHPTLATLGVMTFLRGIGISANGGRTISDMPEVIRYIGSGKILEIPIPLLIFLLASIVTAVLLGRTQLGKNIYMLGSNINAAYYSGVNTKRVILAIYIYSSLMCVVASLVMTAHFNSANMNYGDSYLLLTVLAIIMGGANPNGGFGKVWGAVLALFILQVISTGLNKYGVSNYISLSTWGIVLIFTFMVKYGVNNWYIPWTQRREADKQVSAGS